MGRPCGQFHGWSREARCRSRLVIFECSSCGGEGEGESEGEGEGEVRVWVRARVRARVRVR